MHKHMSNNPEDKSSFCISWVGASYRQKDTTIKSNLEEQQLDEDRRTPFFLNNFSLNIFSFKIWDFLILVKKKTKEKTYFFPL